MKTYEQYLNENKVWDQELKNNDYMIRSLLDPNHVDDSYSGKFYDPEENVIYYLKNNKYHREDGPAFIYPNGYEWWLEGIRIDDPQYEFSDEKIDISIPQKLQKAMLDYDLNNLDFIPSPTREIQEYIILNHPEYINNLRIIDNELKQKYSDIISGEDLGI